MGIDDTFVVWIIRTDVVFPSDICQLMHPGICNIATITVGKSTQSVDRLCPVTNLKASKSVYSSLPIKRPYFFLGNIDLMVSRFLPRLLHSSWSLLDSRDQRNPEWTIFPTSMLKIFYLLNSGCGDKRCFISRYGHHCNLRQVPGGHLRCLKFS